MAKRRHQRFVTHQRVELKADDRNALREAWVTDISKGGLFVQTDAPPPLRARVEVTLETPDGSVGLTGEVVHIIDVETATRNRTMPGVGLQFVDLDGVRKTAIEAYVEGLASTLAAVTPPPAPADGAADTGDVIDIIKQVLDGFEKEDVYASIGVSALAPQETIEARLHAIGDLLARTPTGLTAGQASRMAHVRTLVRRLGAMLLDPDRRLDYDIRHGHLDPEIQLGRATPEQRVQLRASWHRLNPKAMPQAEKHANLALRYEGVMKYEEAIRAAREALKFDPFNEDLWRAIHTWQNRLQLMSEGAPAGSE